ncbi:MAG: maleylacetoacetate isomerase [Phyllobacteriaceae bacterium]|nr:maleylacetoacetate isomerase [Phyllobacteriaceae bacterium]
MADITLHNYFRSSTSYRVRIALALKGIDYDYVAHHLRHGGNRAPEFLAVNPQGLVPALVWSDGTVLGQSLAIIEFIDEMVPEPPLLPADPHGRARVRMLSQMIGCDIHPVNNLRVLNAIRERFGADDAAVAGWFRHWVAETFAPMEQMLAASEATGEFCHGDHVTMADLCLVAQVANNGRFGVDMEPYPTIRRIHEACMAIEAFQAAAPMNQPDAE